MKRINFVIALCALFSPALAQDDATSSKCDLSAVLQVDGIANEWPMTWQEDEDKKFNFNVCSDDNNLYVRVKAKDEFVKRKIGMFGFTVWMDASGKKKKKLGLTFPTGAEGKEKVQALREQQGDQPKNMSSSERADFQKMMNRKLIEDVELLELVGLADDPITTTRTGITNGIKIAIAMDSAGAYEYEAVIPFKSFRLSKSSLSVLSIGFETGKYKPEPTKSKGTGQGSVPPGGYGGGGGGGYGGGGYGRTGASQMSRGQGYRGAGGNPQFSSSTSAWTSLKIK